MTGIRRVSQLGTTGESTYVDGSIQAADIALGAVTGEKLANGYIYVQTIYYTSSTTFTKATYPWLRAIKARVQGGGGAGGGTPNTGSYGWASGGGGGSGGYSEKFITNISGLSASETITVGAAGSLVTGGTGGTGGTSSAFSISCTGGVGGTGSSGSQAIAVMSGGSGGTATGGDLNANGVQGGTGLQHDNMVVGGNGANSILGAGAGVTAAYRVSYAIQYNNSSGYGAGGNGASTSEASARTGGTPTQGIVILELYA